ncbi:MAG: hypothetical protein U1F53_18350 [Burkholderiaceae bacterium]
MHTRDKQVKTMADFKGLKMRAPTRQTNQAAGGAGRPRPVGMPLPAIPDAVSKGTIDGFLLPWEVMPSLKLQELVKYGNETDPLAAASAVQRGLHLRDEPGKYDGLPELKKVIDANSGVEAATSRKASRQDLGQQPGRRPQGRARARQRVLHHPRRRAGQLDEGLGAAVRRLAGRHRRQGHAARQMLQDAKDLLAKCKAAK